VQPSVPFILHGGDFCAFMLETPCLANATAGLPGSAEYNLLHCVLDGYAAVQNGFPNVPTVPVLGNHDTVVMEYGIHGKKGAVFASSERMKWLYEPLAKAWATPNSIGCIEAGDDQETASNFTCVEARRTILLGGYYATRIANVGDGKGSANNVVILALNNNYWSSISNPAIENVTGKAYQIGQGMMDWAQQQVTQASLRGDKVMIVAHIPPYSTSTGPMWSTGRYYEWISFLEPYYASGTVMNHFYGHMHNDEWMVTRSCQGTGPEGGECTGEPLGVMVTSPGITFAYPAANPALRMLSFNAATLGLYDMKTWVADLHQANDDGVLKWALEYTFNDAFQMSNDGGMTPTNMALLVDRMALNTSKEWNQYRGNATGTYWCKAWMGSRGRKADEECLQGCQGECKRLWLNVLNGTNTTGAPQQLLGASSPRTFTDTATPTTTGQPTTPEQVHLAIGHHPSEMTVQWAMQASPPPPSSSSAEAIKVEYWMEMETMPTAVVSSVPAIVEPFPVPVSWEVTGQFIRANISRTMSVCRGTMTNLSPRTTYGYRVGSTVTGWSTNFTFRSQSTVNMLPIRVAMLGDFGDTNGRSFPQLQKEAEDGTVEAIIHVGDIAYDLDTRKDESERRRTLATVHAQVTATGPEQGKNTSLDEVDGLDGATGDRFLRDLEPIASVVPYLVSPGNHEFNFNTTAFTHRFNGMPSNAPPIPMEAGTNVGGKKNNWWYSYNIGNVHFISLNSNVVTDPTVVTNTSRYKWQYPVSIQEKQYKWLKKDLQRAVTNRSQAPWIIVHAHFPMYCSQTSSDCTTQAALMRNGLPNHSNVAWEPLFDEFSVDIYVSAHVHSYERFFPVYNGTSNVDKWKANPSVIRNAEATVHIVQGAAGNVEGQDGFSAIKPYSAVRSSRYGYSGLTMHNNSHLEWTFLLTDNSSDAGQVADRMWLIKTAGGDDEKV
jgi:hypothetical protein